MTLQISQVFIFIFIFEACSDYISSSVILLNSVLKKDKNYYLQVSLKEFKYIEKEKRVIGYITDDLKFYSNDSEKE